MVQSRELKDLLLVIVFQVSGFRLIAEQQIDTLGS
jgi:hypothetical protein